MATIALQTLDEKISSVFKQFSRIISLETSVRRSTAIDAMNIPYEGVKAKLQNLPLSAADLFTDKFLDTMESEVKHIETTSKLSFREPALCQPRPPNRATHLRQTSRRQDPPLCSFRPHYDNLFRDVPLLLHTQLDHPTVDRRLAPLACVFPRSFWGRRR